jgi:hypothetical protein
MFKVTEEDVFFSMDMSQLGLAFARRTDPYAAAEGAKVAKIFTFVGSSFVGRDISIRGTAKGIVFLDVIFEGI